MDRNLYSLILSGVYVWSPSTRRAWIEIYLHSEAYEYCVVALHPEGVDRNIGYAAVFKRGKRVALHPEGVDRNV